MLEAVKFLRPICRLTLHLSGAAAQVRAMQAHCYFQRREDYEPKKTPEESPFRLFIARCLKCDCAQLKLAAGFDEESGETRLLVRCGKCGQTESVRIS